MKAGIEMIVRMHINFSILVLATAVLLACQNRPVTTLSHHVTIQDKTYAVEIADTDPERELGLMNRTSLATDTGMLFVFDTPGFYAFYMKDTLIPLDIIWINSSQKIVYIVQNAIPLDETDLVPTGSAKWVLELNGGTVSLNQIQVGDTVSID